MNGIKKVLFSEAPKGPRLYVIGCKAYFGSEFTDKLTKRYPKPVETVKLPGADWRVYAEENGLTTVGRSPTPEEVASALGLTLDQMLDGSFIIDPFKTPRAATLVVAANDSKDKTRADYVCDGSHDEAEINAAIAALSAVGGSVVLLEGTYNISGQINLATGTALMGQGKGTVLRIPDGHNANINMIVGSSINRVLIKDLMIDGNKANQTAGTMYGIYFDTVTRSKVEGCWVESLRDDGIYLLGSSDYNTIMGNTCRDNYVDGIYLSGSASNTIDGNTCEGNGPTGNGILLKSSDFNTIVGNVCRGNDEGIYLSAGSDSNAINGNACRGNYGNGIYLTSSDYNTVVGNACDGNGEHGIKLMMSDSSTVVGNTVVSNSQTVNNAYDGIIIDGSSSYNNVQCNTSRRGTGANRQRYGIRVDDATGTGNIMVDNDVYDGGSTANFSDAGTGTIIDGNRGNVGRYQTTTDTWAAYAGPTGTPANSTKVIIYSSGEPGHRLYCYSGGGWRYVEVS